ncbi:UNVERIFIED_ORG: hypothetical protein B2H98_06940 [Clostridium botulinum]
MKIEMKFLSLEIVKRNGRKYDDFCKEIFKTCREAYRVLHFEMNIPNNRLIKMDVLRGGKDYECKMLYKMERKRTKVFM